MSQTREQSESDADAEFADEFVVHPARYGGDMASHRRADVRVEQAARRPVVTVTFGGERWQFERNRKGVLSKTSGPSVPAWVAAALRNTGVGEVVG